MRCTKGHWTVMSGRRRTQFICSLWTGRHLRGQGGFSVSIHRGGSPFSSCLPHLAISPRPSVVGQGIFRRGILQFDDPFRVLPSSPLRQQPLPLHGTLFDMLKKEHDKGSESGQAQKVLILEILRKLQRSTDHGGMKAERTGSGNSTAIGVEERKER